MIATATLALLLQANAPSWTIRIVSEDGKPLVWTLGDSGDRGASINFRCHSGLKPDALSISTKESLLDMADADDGEIKVVFMSSASEKRNEEDGWLARSQREVTFKEYAAAHIIAWLRKKQNVGQELTFILSNNDRREVYSFMNRSATTEERALVCGKPKRKPDAAP